MSHSIQKYTKERLIVDMQILIFTTVDLISYFQAFGVISEFFTPEVSQTYEASIMAEGSIANTTPFNLEYINRLVIQ
jgi:hypothetical protein